MTKEIKDLFSDKQYCLDEICRIRHALSDKAATRETFEKAIETLIYMMLYCPEDIQGNVQAQLSETELRLTYYDVAFFKKVLKL